MRNLSYTELCLTTCMRYQSHSQSATILTTHDRNRRFIAFTAELASCPSEQLAGAAAPLRCSEPWPPQPAPLRATRDALPSCRALARARAAARRSSLRSHDATADCAAAGADGAAHARADGAPAADATEPAIARPSVREIFRALALGLREVARACEADGRVARTDGLRALAATLDVPADASGSHLCESLLDSRFTTGLPQRDEQSSGYRTLLEAASAVSHAVLALLAPDPLATAAALSTPRKRRTDDPMRLALTSHARTPPAGRTMRELLAQSPMARGLVRSYIVACERKERWGVKAQILSAFTSTYTLRQFNVRAQGWKGE